MRNLTVAGSRQLIDQALRLDLVARNALHSLATLVVRHRAIHAVADSAPSAYISRRSRRGSEHGQNLIEFAMLMPVILVFIYAIVVFGLAMNVRASLQQAVREGARQSAVGKSDAEVQALAAGNAPDWIDPADVLICHPIDSDGSQGQVGDPVRVYIHKDGAEGYPYTLVNTGGMLSTWGVTGITVRMSPRATSRLEKSVAVPTNCP